MRIVAFKRLREFYEIHSDAEQQLKLWFKETKKAHWNSPNDIKKEIGSASILTDNRVVFNIKGNKYRLIAKLNFKYGRCWIRFIGTHADYDKIDATKI